MKFTKIKQVKHDFKEFIGPSRTITLGFSADDRSFILGTFYIGPHCEDDVDQEMEALEKVVDEICLNSGL
jgi:hypothetical protein